MRVIKLTHGSGNGVDTACLMTASNMLMGKGELGDDNPCVCPLLRTFIVTTNDYMPVDLLGELYGDLAWEILGTRNDDPDVLHQRACAFADWAVREIAPLALDADGLHEHAETLRAMPPITDRDTAIAAARAARAAHAAAAGAAVYAAAAGAARAAACAAIWNKCPEIIRRAAAIGDRRPVECVITRDELCEALGGTSRL